MDKGDKVKLCPELFTALEKIDRDVCFKVCKMVCKKENVDKLRYVFKATLLSRNDVNNWNRKKYDMHLFTVQNDERDVLECMNHIINLSEKEKLYIHDVWYAFDVMCKRAYDLVAYEHYNDNIKGLMIKYATNFEHRWSKKGWSNVDHKREMEPKPLDIFGLMSLPVMRND